MAARSRHSSPSSPRSRSVSPLGYHSVTADDLAPSYEMTDRSPNTESPQSPRRSLSPGSGPSRSRSRGPYMEISQADDTTANIKCASPRPPRPRGSRFRECESPSPPASPVESISDKGMSDSRSRLADNGAAPRAQWHIHWVIPGTLLVLYIAGVIAAFGHHLFYISLDGEPATDQLKMIRYGTALAFFVKSTLVGTVVLCYRQRIWHTFRQKPMSVAAIDGLFAATEDPSKFGNWEMIRNGKFATLMAVCSWLLPIASVLSPASLTTDIRTKYDSTTCPSAGTLDFTREASYDFRDPTAYPGFSLAFWNTTDVKGEEEGWFDYYDQPSKNARRLAVTSVYLRKAASNPDASLIACGEGWNCTYILEFEAPGYNCKDITVDDDENPPFNTSILAPEGPFIYKATVDLGEYISPQVETGPDGVPVEGPPYPDMLGAFQTEPVLWIGHAINTSTPYEPGSELSKNWTNVHEAKLFKCVLHETRYKFNVTYHGFEQHTTRLSREFVKPLVDTTIEYDPVNGSALAPTPQDNYVMPNTNKGRYKMTAAYHALGALMRNFLRGDIKYVNPYYLTKSDISETRLLDQRTSYPVHNLMEEVQDMFEDMIITLLSEPHLVITAVTNVPCEKSQTVNVYVYHREGLWIGYAIVVSITFVFIIVGFWSIHQNGVASQTTFSSIMVTTRNPTLDRLSVGACIGGHPLPKELAGTKLKFGVLLEDGAPGNSFGRVEHCAFGTESETKEIVKGGAYAGLKRWRGDGRRDDGVGDEKQTLLHADF